MAVSYNFIKNELTSDSAFQYERRKKITEKRENVIAVTRSCRFHIKTTCRGIRYLSVLRSSSCKFSDEKINQIVVTLWGGSVFRDETLIFA